MFFPGSVLKEADADEVVNQGPAPLPCPQGHRSTLSLRTQEGGTICLLCLSNLISDPHALTLHVSYALSQLSLALSQPTFLHSLLSSHAHFLVSPLVHALSSFDDDAIAHQLIDIIAGLSDNASVIRADFVARVADNLSSGALAWSRRQLYSLHCFGVLLNCQTDNLYGHIKDKDSLVSNLVVGLQLPSEEIRGEIMFVLYKLSILQYVSKDDDGVDILSAFCPKLLHMSLEALMKTQRDDVRLNCVALLTILAREGLFGNACANEISSMSSDEADCFMQTSQDGTDGPPLNILFAEAIKGPLLSTDSQVQISTVDLIFYYLSSESAPSKQIQVLVEENIVDYVFEILRLSECKDPVVNSCLRVLDLCSIAEQTFRMRLVVGFASLIPVLCYVAEVPFHPVQSQTLKLIWNCVSDCPGVASASHVEEIIRVLTKMLKKHSEGEMGLQPESFMMICSIFVALFRTPSFNGTVDLLLSVQQALKHAILACLSTSEQDPDQLLHSLCLLREALAYSHEEFSTNNSRYMELSNCVIDVCTSHILPWLLTAINEMNEETTLGVYETFQLILLQNSDMQGKELANSLVSASWFSFSFGCLGYFPTEKMKWRVYLMLSSLVDVLLGDNTGQPIRDAASCLPSDPNDLLFLLGQNSSHNLELSSCQLASVVILHTSSLYDDRVVDDKLVLASLEQYILVNSADFERRVADSPTMMQLLNLYGLYRGLAKMSSQIPNSPEVERIFFQFLTDNEWDLPSSVIHPMSLKWLFQQEKISKSLSYQILKFCRNISSNGSHVIIHEKNTRNIDVRMIAKLVAVGDNYTARLLVCLLMQLIEEEGQEHDIICVIHLMTTVIHIIPAASEQLCLHGIGNAIQILHYNSVHSSSQQIVMAILPLVFSILSFVCPETLSNDESWVAVTTKLMNCLFTTVSVHSWDHEGLLVIGTLSLILHQSTKKGLEEASRSIVLNSHLVSAINSVISAACSMGPALVEYDEGTSLGENLIFMLLLCYFSLRSLNCILPGAVDWQSFFDRSNGLPPLSTIKIQCHDLCRLMHFGPPKVKLVASYCLSESFARLSEQINSNCKQLKCSLGYLGSAMAVLEGLVFYEDIRVAINCALCLSIILGWENLDIWGRRITARTNWCRLIVEELVMSLAVPCLPAKPITNYHKPAVHVAVALLKLQQTPGWMRAVFDARCISGIIENLAPANVSSETVLLFRELLKSDFLNTEHIDSLNHVLQARRKQVCTNNAQDDLTDELTQKVVSPDNLGEVCEYLIHLMSSASNTGGLQWENRRLLDEIEMFFRTLTVEDGSRVNN